MTGKQSRAKDRHRGGFYQRKLKYYFPKVWKRDGGVCQICFEPVWIGWKLVDPNHREAPSLDHIIPLSEGGKWNMGNLRLAHRKCDNMLGGLRSWKYNANSTQVEVSDGRLLKEDCEQGRRFPEAEQSKEAQDSQDA